MPKKGFLFILFLLFCFFNIKDCFAMPDESFVANVATEVAARVIPQFIDGNGKIVVIGQFEVVNGQFRNGIARLNPDGSVDPTFYTNVENAFYSSDSVNKIRVAVPQSDGKILIGGTFNKVNGVSRLTIARLNQDGSLDNSFNPPIVEDSSNIIYSIVPLPDGRILAAGGYIRFGGSTSRSIVRFNNDGSVDNSFIGTFSLNIKKIVVQQDGKILFTTSFAPSEFTRLMADGSIDSSFNPTFDGRVNNIAIQADQKIIVSGEFDRVNNITKNNIARLNPDGTLDTSFTTTPSVNCCVISAINALNIQPDGKILIGGIFDKINGVVRADIARINSDGTLDTTFVPNVRSSFGTTVDNYEIMSVLTNSDGSAIIGGHFNKVDTSFRSNIAKINLLDGSLNNAFDPVIGMRSSAKIVKIQPDGKILVGGDFTIINNKRARFIARLNQDSSFDETFSLNNQAISAISAIELQPDNKILVGGLFFNETPSSRTYVSRLNSDGSLDTAFSAIVNRTVSAVCRQTDGKILIGGNFDRVNTAFRFGFARLNSNGSLDSSFSPTSFNNSTGFGTFISKIVIQPDNKILVAGQFQQVGSGSKIGIARLNADGSLDTGFTSDLSAPNSTNVIVYDISLLSDGKILATGLLGSSTNLRKLAKFNTDGSNDSSFSPADTRYNVPYKLLVQNDGKFLIGTSTDSFYTNKGLLKFNSDGSLDGTLTGVGADYAIYSVEKLLDDKLIIVGGFTKFNGVVRLGIAKITLSSSTAFDYDGDGKADLSVFRPSNGIWYLNQTQNGFTGFQFGIASDRIAPADYDGDGKTDLAVFRDGIWYLQRSSLGFVGIPFGTSEDIPMPADYDGDGKADLAVFRPSNGTWYLQQSQQGFAGIRFGQSGDRAVAADYDGDGRADLAVFRAGIWYIQRSLLGLTGIQFGEENDKAVPADYDGDGKADLAVFRPSNGIWYLQRSQLGFTGIQFGISSDLPTPADYDGDAKADVAVFRSGTWYLNRSTQSFIGIQFGISTDLPAPNAFVR